MMELNLGAEPLMNLQVHPLLVHVMLPWSGPRCRSSSWGQGAYTSGPT